MTKGNCDCCDRRNVMLTRCWATGIETFACDVCLDHPPSLEEADEAAELRP